MEFVTKFSSVAERYFKKLPFDVSRRILKKLAEVEKEPFRYLRHYEGEYFKLRIGDYRALIDVDFGEGFLIVEVLDKRGRVYK